MLFAAGALTLWGFAGVAVGSQTMIRMRPVDLRAYSPLYSDGERWAAYESTPRRLRVIDARLRRTFVRAVPRDCLLASVGGGVMLFDCPAFADADRPGTVEQYAIENIATGQVKRLEAPVVKGARSALLRIGSQWAEGTGANEQLTGSNFRVYFNWHTQATIEGSLGEAETSVVRDLNLPRLTGTLCVPLQRLPSSPAYYFEEEERFAWVAYAPPFAVTGRDRPAEGRTLQLERCGSPRHEVLEERRQALAEGQLQIGGGAVSWPCGQESWPARNGEVCATRLNPRGPHWHGRIYRATDPRGVTPAGAQHTATTVYWSGQPGLEDSEESSEGGKEEIYRARLP